MRLKLVLHQSIAIHTFVVFVLHWRVTRFTLRIVSVSIWLLTALVIGVCSRGRQGYYGDTGYCEYGTVLCRPRI